MADEYIGCRPYRGRCGHEAHLQQKLDYFKPCAQLQIISETDDAAVLCELDLETCGTKAEAVHLSQCSCSILQSALALLTGRKLSGLNCDSGMATFKRIIRHSVSDTRWASLD